MFLSAMNACRLHSASRRLAERFLLFQKEYEENTKRGGSNQKKGKGKLKRDYQQDDCSDNSQRCLLMKQLRHEEVGTFTHDSYLSINVSYYPTKALPHEITTKWHP